MASTKMLFNCPPFNSILVEAIHDADGVDLFPQCAHIRVNGGQLLELGNG
jgi:hypothetical protein